MSDIVMIAFDLPTEGRDEEFLDWNRSKHMPDVCAVEGVESGRFYEVDPASST